MQIDMQMAVFVLILFTGELWRNVDVVHLITMFRYVKLLGNMGVWEILEGSIINSFGT